LAKIELIFICCKWR